MDLLTSIYPGGVLAGRGRLLAALDKAYRLRLAEKYSQLALIGSVVCELEILNLSGR